MEYKDLNYCRDIFIKCEKYIIKHKNPKSLEEIEKILYYLYNNIQKILHRLSFELTEEIVLDYLTTNVNELLKLAKKNNCIYDYKVRLMINLNNDLIMKLFIKKLNNAEISKTTFILTKTNKGE